MYIQDVKQLLNRNHPPEQGKEKLNEAAVLILVPLRLGVDQLNPVYFPALKVWIMFISTCMVRRVVDFAMFY